MGEERKRKGCREGEVGGIHMGIFVAADGLAVLIVFVSLLNGVVDVGLVVAC